MCAQPSAAPPGVLVADDEHVRFLLGLTLGQAGFNPLVVADGHEAVEMLLRYKDEVRVVLLDILMPRLAPWP
jgi:DNA-binding response OmpR family regulator